MTIRGAAVEVCSSCASSLFAHAGGAKVQSRPQVDLGERGFHAREPSAPVVAPPKKVDRRLLAWRRTLSDEQKAISRDKKIAYHETCKAQSGTNRVAFPVGIRVTWTIPGLAKKYNPVREATVVGHTRFKVLIRENGSRHETAVYSNVLRRLGPSIADQVRVLSGGNEQPLGPRDSDPLE